MSSQRQSLGRQGEEAATEFFTNKGYRVLARNYRCRFGEIDLIVEKKHLLVFVEVKARTSRKFGSGAESINRQKQRKIITCAQLYLSSKRLEDRPVRFDVILVQVSADGQQRLEHLEHAFELET